MSGGDDPTDVPPRPWRDPTVVLSGRTEVPRNTDEAQTVDTLPPSGGSDADPDATAVERGRRRGAPRRTTEPLPQRPDDYADLLDIDPQHYVIERQIAQGGMGRIYAARDRRLGRPVAIKELLTESSHLRARFLRETRITARLQHPGIISVLEAGRWGNEHPFFAMKLVAGRPFHKVIAEKKTLAERLSLVPNVIDAVDALAYAHSQRVIHRDLKPANILIGDFGETVVIDWGIAKDLSTASDPSEISAGPFRAVLEDDSQTVAGGILGTPAYMPAEQARGEAVDERVDVYALGAILYHVLAGKAPYRGSPQSVVAAVVAGPPTPIDQVVEQVPPDLAAIVTKAMAHSAADRYPTAKELAIDLKAFETGQLVGAHRYTTRQLVRRWMRRHRVTLSVAAVLSSLLVVATVVSAVRIVREKRVAETQRALAEQSQRDAEAMLDFMLFDLKDKLEPLGQLPLLDAVAKQASDYYARQSGTLAVADQARRAAALTSVGEVLLERGDLSGARTQIETALRIREQLVALEPSRPEHWRDLGKSYDLVGDTLGEAGDTKGALAAYRSGLAARQRLVALDPSNLEWRATLPRSHSRISDALTALGDSAQSLTEAQTALAMRQEIAVRRPDDLDAQDGLADGYGRLGEVKAAQGDFEGALASHRDALSILEKLVAREPQHVQYLRDLSVRYDRIADILLGHRGDSSGALTAYQAGLAIAERLSVQDPSNATWQFDLSISYNNVGGIQKLVGDLGGAEINFRKSLAIRERLAAKDPENPRWQRSLSIGHENVGSMLWRRGDFDAALVEYRGCLVISERLLAGDQTNHEWRRDRAIDHRNIGRILLDKGDVPGASSELQASFEDSLRLATSDQRNFDWQLGLVVAHHELARVKLMQGDPSAALAERAAAMSILSGLGERDGENVEIAYWRAAVHRGNGEALLAKKDARAAAAEVREAIRRLEPLLARNRQDTSWQLELARAQTVLGDALAAQGDPGARAAYRLAVAQWQQSAKLDPGQHEALVGLGKAREKLGRCCGR